MTERSNKDFDACSEKIIAVAADVGALIVPNLPELSDRSGTPRADIDVDDSLIIIRHVRPRLIYLIESNFDLDTEISDLLDESDDENELHSSGPNVRSAAPATFEKLVKRWRKYDGQKNLVIVAYMADGVLHNSGVWPLWRDEFDSELQSAEEEAREALSDELNRINERDSKEICKKAVILSDHPAFNFGRPSFEKRLFLAGQFFQKLASQELQAITNHAEKLDWLNKSGFKPPS